MYTPTFQRQDKTAIKEYNNNFKDRMQIYFFILYYIMRMYVIWEDFFLEDRNNF